MELQTGSKNYRPFPVIDPVARGLSDFFVGYAKLVIRQKFLGVGVVTLLLAGAFGVGVNLMPKLDYLPDGNANFIFGRISVPAGYSMEETVKVAERMEKAARPLWEGRTTEDGPPAIERFFFVAYSGGAFAGA